MDEGASMKKSQSTMQETTTDVSAADVLARAKNFFANRPALYSSFLDMEGDGFCTFRGQGGEEVVIAASPAADGAGTRVTGSSYLFDMQVSRFFATLSPVGE
jgi:hypothetical protein